ncbi:MAG: hypothetical protein ACTSSF_00430 [Candidatus Heimdallarchaeaceae archaeon]
MGIEKYIISPYEPASAWAGLIWVDTSATPYIVKMRNSTNTAWINIFGKARIVDKTSNYTVTKEDSFTVFTNKGATSTVTFTLPAAEAGLKYTFVRIASQEVRIDPNGSETIAGGSAGKYAILDADYESITVQATQTGKWEVVAYYGWGGTFES